MTNNRLVLKPKLDEAKTLGINRNIENGLLKLRYGEFTFRRNHILKCKYTFPENNNKKIYKLFEYSIDGSILILQNPNRKIVYFEKLINLLNFKSS